MFLAKLIVNLMIYDTNFNKILFIDWLKMFITPKHVFTTSPMQYIISNMIKETIKNVFNN
jgi:hypothetical protein